MATTVSWLLTYENCICSSGSWPKELHIKPLGVATLGGSRRGRKALWFFRSDKKDNDAVMTSFRVYLSS